MQKTKLGISVGLLGAVIYFSAIFGGGYLISIILCGYVLLVEDNPWLRKASVKSILLLIVFSLLSFVLGIIPDISNIITGLMSAFGKYFASEFVSGFNTVIDNIIAIVKTIVFVILGIKAFNQGTLKLPIIDKVINKYMD